ncbi:ABC transporter permease [Dialister hominis]|uniref:ABC transporter permease n=1 Tax=Dialister hominis TaxID=2582419 RepID=UPI003FF0C40A
MEKAEYNERLQMAINDGSNINPDDLVIVNLDDLGKIREKLIKSERAKFRRKFLRNRNAVIGSVLVLLVLTLAIFSPLIAPKGPYVMDVSNRLAHPSMAHILGTDTFGRDLLARIIYGAQMSMIIGASVAFFSCVLGMAIGLYASYYPKLDAVLMRICDGISSVPAILLAIAFMAVLGPSPHNVILSLTLVYIPTIARIARSRALAVKEMTYIEAMRCIGATSNRIIWHHIAPNILSPVIVQTSFIFAKAIIVEAALSFLGVGVPVPTPSWGNILMEGKTVIYKAWWMIVFPGIITAVSVLGLNMLGDGLRDVIDPHTK